MSRFSHMLHDFETPMRRAKLGLLWAFCLALGSQEMWGQFTDGLNVEFGKNRVQHRGFEWNYFEEGIFEVYHYREGDQIAGQVTRILSEEAKPWLRCLAGALRGPFKFWSSNRKQNSAKATSA